MAKAKNMQSSQKAKNSISDLILSVKIQFNIYANSSSVLNEDKILVQLQQW